MVLTRPGTLIDMKAGIIMKEMSLRRPQIRFKIMDLYSIS